MRLKTPQTAVALLSMPERLLGSNGLWTAADRWIEWLMLEARHLETHTLLESAARKCADVFADEKLNIGW